MRDEDKTKEQLISELAELRQHLQGIPFPIIHTIEATSDIIGMVDSEGKTLYLNSAGRRTLGYEGEEDLSKIKVTEYFPEISIPVLVNEALPTAAKKGIWKGEMIIRSKDGLKEIPVSQIIISHKNLKEEVEFFSIIIRDITELKQVEDALRESEERYRTLIETSPDGIVVTDLEGNFTLLNHRAVDLHGYSSPEELIGTSAVAKVAPEDLDSLQKRVLESLTNKKVQSFEHNLIRKDGSQFPAEATATALYDKQGQPSGFLTIIRDITERKKSEEALWESQERLSKFINSAENSYHILDANFKILEINRGALEAIYSAYPAINAKEQVVGKNFEQFYPFLKNELPHFSEVIKTGKRYENILTITHPELGDLIISFICFKVGDDLGIIAEDITEREQAKAALQESEKKYRSLFEESRDAIYITTEEGQCIDVNQSALELFGYTKEELMKLDIQESYVRVADRNKFQQKIKQKGFVRDFEAKIRKKDGTPMDCLLTSTERRDKDGKILGYQGIIRDITEQKKLEAQLRQSQKLESMGVLAGGIAHEFNNLLSPIMGYTEMLLGKQSEGSVEKSNLEQINRAGQRAIALVQQILAFSRKSMSERKQLQLDLIVQEALKFLSKAIPSTISIKQEIAVNLPPILGSSHEIHQVIVNLCINANQAMPEGGELKVRLHKEELEEIENLQGEKIQGPFVCLSIQDTGIGIDETTMEHIFDPFYTTKKVGEGTGLGLSVVLGIIEQHHGIIRVDSKIGKGSNFRVYFPISHEKEDSFSEPKTPLIVTGNESILLVDDEPAVKNTTSALLEDLGYQVTAFTDCFETLVAFENHPQDFDLVITDYTMPTMTGKQLAKKLREIRPDIPIVLTTGFNQAVTPESVQDWGIDELLMKPSQKEKLSQIVRKVLDQNKS